MDGNQPKWGPVEFQVTKVDNQTTIIAVSGRVRWALECLIMAGRKGCTPLDTPGPHWSDYVLRLRSEGVDIETIHESHGGPFSLKEVVR